MTNQSNTFTLVFDDEVFDVEASSCSLRCDDERSKKFSGDGAAFPLLLKRLDFDGKSPVVEEATKVAASPEVIKEGTDVDLVGVCNSHGFFSIPPS